jgi:O-antigen/teichoic acid export membrane protein
LKLFLPFFLVSLGAFGIFLSWGLSTFIALFICISFFIYKILPTYKPKAEIDKNSVRKMLHFSFGNYIANLFGVMPGLILPLMVTNIISAKVTAYFYISWMISGILCMFPFSTSQSLLSETSYDLKKMRKNFERAIKFIAFLLIPGVIFVLLFGEQILLLFGEEYSKNASLSLKIFALATIPYTVNILFITLKNLEKKVMKIVLMNGFIAFFTLSLSYISIVRNFGLEGIALSWLMAQLIVSIGLFLSRIFKKK